MLSFFLWNWPQTYVVYQAQQELYTNLSLLVDEFQDWLLFFWSVSNSKQLCSMYRKVTTGRSTVFYSNLIWVCLKLFLPSDECAGWNHFGRTYVTRFLSASAGVCFGLGHRPAVRSKGGLWYPLLVLLPSKGLCTGVGIYPHSPGCRIQV